MLELGELEKHAAEFSKRNVQVVVASLEGQDDAQKTKADLPALVVLADRDGGLIRAVNAVDTHPAPVGGGEMAVPTTFLIDRQGIVRWVFRPSSGLRRLSPAEALTAVDAHLTPGD
jgi:peroxiredoxin